jgi:hypothetical protein
MTSKVTLTILHESGPVQVAPYMVFDLLKYNVLTKINDTTYKVVDEQEYWKVMKSLD